MLNLSPSRKCHEQDGKEDLAGVQETRTIGSGLRGHSDDQIRPLKPDDRPETTKEYVRQETEEEDALTENKGDLGSRKGRNVPGLKMETYFKIEGCNHAAQLDDSRLRIGAAQECA